MSKPMQSKLVESTSQLFINVSILSPLIAIAVAIIWGKWNLYKWLFLFLIISFVSDITSYILANVGLPNLYIINSYYLISGILIILYFKSTNRFSKHFHFITIVLFSLVYISSFILFDGLHSFNSIGTSLEAVLMILLSLYVFYNIYTKEEEMYLEKTPEFWFTSAILIYNSLALFSFLLSSDILSQTPDRFYNSWILHNSANILKNILFAVGFIVAGKSGK